MRDTLWYQGIVGGITEIRVRIAGFGSWLCHLLVHSLWPSHLTSETHPLGKTLTSSLSASKHGKNQWWHRVNVKVLGSCNVLHVLSSHCDRFFHNSLLSKQNAFSALYSFLGRNLQLNCCWHSLFQKNAIHNGQRSTAQCQLPTCFGMCVCGQGLSMCLGHFPIPSRHLLNME